MSRGRVTIREVLEPGDPALGPAHRLLRRTFHRDETVDLADWRETLKERAARVWTDLAWHLIIAERAGKVVGMVSGSYLGSVNVGMVGSLALDASLRGQGIGPRLRARLRTCFDRDARRVRGRPLEAIVGEVSHDNPWLRHLVARERAIALDIPYSQPALRPGDDPSRLVLYYQPLARPRRSLGVAETRRLLYSLWRRLYRIPQPLKRPAFSRMLRSLAGRKRVGGKKLPPPEPRGKV